MCECEIILIKVKKFCQALITPKSFIYMDCLHEDNIIDFETGIKICKICGVEITEADFEPEWKYQKGSKRLNSRCKPVVNASSGIAKTFELKGVKASKAVIESVAERYRAITNGDTYRSDNRLQRIVACMYYTLRERGKNIPIEIIERKFGIGSSSMGVNAYIRYYGPQEHSKPKDLLAYIMSKVDLDMKYLPCIEKVCDWCDKASSKLNSGSSSTIAAAIVYFYMVKHPDITPPKKKMLSEKLDISDVTLTNMVNEIKKVTNYQQA